MNQNEIKLRQNQAHPFEVDEMDANLKELDDRTKHSDPQLNTIQLLAEKVAEIMSDMPDVSSFEASIQLDARDVENRKRSNHEGTQPVSTIEGFNDAVDARVPDVSEFETSTHLNARDVENRKRSNHDGTQPVSSIEGFEDAVDARVPDVSEFETSTHLNARDVESRKRSNHTGLQPVSSIEGFNDAVNQLTKSKQLIKTTNFTLTPADNDVTISNNGVICTIDPDQSYQDIFMVAMKNISDSEDGSIVCVARTGWAYKLNDDLTVPSGVFSFPAGSTCTIIKFEGTNKIYIDGGVE